MRGRNPVADTVVLKAPEKEEIVPMIETDSNPQQSWGDQRTQGAINVVPLK